MWTICSRLIIFSTLLSLASAEGSRNLFPASTKVCTDYSSGGSCRAYLEYTTAAYGPAPRQVKRRTLFYVFARAGETILMGSSAKGMSLADIVLYTPGVVNGPPGAEALPTKPSFSCMQNQTNKGRISTREEELAGPQMPGSTRGYIPCSFDVVTTGIHHVAFYGPTGNWIPQTSKTVDGDLNMSSPSNWNEYQGTTVSAWDVTVRMNTDGGFVDLVGRVFTYVMCLATHDTTRPVYFNLFPVTNDGYIYRVSTAGIDSPAWVIYGSKRGFRDPSGNPLYHDVRGETATFDRLYSSDNATAPAFATPDIRHFLNPPDPAVLQFLSLPPPQLTIFTAVTPPIFWLNDSFTITTDDLGKAFDIVLSDGHPTLPRLRQMRGMLMSPTMTVAWDGKDDHNVPIPSGTYLNVQTTVHEGEYHCILLNVVSNMGGGPILQKLNAPSCQGLNGGCLGAFFNDLGYELTTNVMVGEPDGPLCPFLPVGPGKSDPIRGFDTMSKARAFGNNSGLDLIGWDCTSPLGFGDSKGLDLWTYYPNTANASILYSGDSPMRPFQSTWQTLTANEELTLPLTLPSYSGIQIQWGDGSVNRTVTGYPTHRYANIGNYTIVIFGLLPGFSFLDMPKMAARLLSIQSWGGFTVDQSSQFVFANCTNLVSINAQDQPKLQLYANFTGFFFGCSSLEAPEMPLNWDLRNAISLRLMFALAKSFNGPINFYTPLVEDTSLMFAFAESFNSSVILNTSQVRKMNRMFYRASSFNHPLVWDGSNVLSMNGMFEDAISFNQPLNFNSDKVITMPRLFAGAKSFDQPLSLGTGQVVDMSGMFSGASSFNSEFSAATRTVKDFRSMFQGASAFNKQIGFATGNATNMSFMFADATSFNHPVPFTYANAISTAYMFANASSFNQPIYGVADKLQSMEGMFQDAESFNSPVSLSTMGPLTTTRAMFRGATAFDQPVSFNSTHVVDMSSMFEDAVSYNQPTALDTAQVLNMSRMFAGAVTFNQPLNFETANVMDVTEMFAGSKLPTEHYANWSTTSMFECQGFCDYCALPRFQLCQPCSPIIQSAKGSNVCHCPLDQVAFDTAKCVFPCLSLQTGDLNCTCPDGMVSSTVPPIGCVPISCEAVGYTGSPGNCSCARGYAGTVQYVGGNATGCVPLPCPAPVFFWTDSSQCVCGTGYIGTPAIVNDTRTGCYPNMTTVLVPLSNSSNGTLVNATDGVVVILPPEDYGGPGGTVVVTVTNGTNGTQSTIVTIQILNPDGTPRSIKNLSTPFRFTMPLIPGAADAVSACEGTEPVAIVPKCQWLDLVTNRWTSTGCTTSHLTSTDVECSCVHMTDFALVLPNNNRVPIQQFLELTPTNIQTYPDGLMTISLVLAIFAMLLALSACRDATDTSISPDSHGSASEEDSSTSKWASSETLRQEYDTRFLQQFKLGLQAYHTWAALLCRRSGTSFRSVDRLFVTLMMLLALMSMSANYHRRDQTLMGRTVVIASSVMASFIPSQIFAFLFSHTGEMGSLERWQYSMGLRQPSRFKCLDYRFAAKWRYVWYSIVLVTALMLIWYILSIALMFDQNPWYYCRGQTTQAWIMDFLLQYTITVFVVEPTKIALMVLGRRCFAKKTRSRPPSAMLEPTFYQPLEREDSIR